MSIDPTRPKDFLLHRSYHHIAVALAMLALALAGTWLSPVDLGVRFGITGIAVVLFLFECHKALQQAAHSVQSVRLTLLREEGHDDGAVTHTSPHTKARIVVTVRPRAANGEWEGELLPDTVVTPRLIVMSLRPLSPPTLSLLRRRRVLPIWPDQLPAEEFRRLRVLLRNA